MKYKVGDKVRVVATKIDKKDTNDLIELIKEIRGRVYEVRSVHDDFYSVWKEDKIGYWYFSEINLAPVEKTLYDLEVGDVVIDTSYGKERTVLDVLTQSCLLSWNNDKDRADDWHTFKTLDQWGYKVKGTPETKPPVKMTVAEVAEKLGHEVEIVK